MLELGIVPDADFFEQRFDDFKVDSRTFSPFDSSSYPDRAMFFSGALMFTVGIRISNGSLYNEIAHLKNRIKNSPL